MTYYALLRFLFLQHNRFYPQSATRRLTAHHQLTISRTRSYASWLNQVERWFALITHQAIRRGSFRSVRDPVQKIDGFVTHYNTHQRPFAWTATADSIFAKLQHLCKVINGTQH